MRRAALVTYAGYAVNVLSSLALPLVVARVLGIPALGLFSLLSLPLVIGQTVDSGLALSSASRAARRHHDGGAREWDAMRSACGALAGAYLVVGAIAVCVAATVLTGRDRIAESVLLLASFVAGAVFVATSPARAAAVAAERFRSLAEANAVGAVTLLVVSSLGVWTLGWWGLCLALPLSAACGRAHLRRRMRDLGFTGPFGLGRPSLSGLHELRTDILAGLTIAGTGQLVTMVDLLVLSAFADQGVVGAYRLGVLIPNQIMAVLFLGADLAMPRLSHARSDAEAAALTARLTPLLGFAAGVTLSVAAFEAPVVVHLLSGTQPPYAVAFLRLFCVAQAMNSVIHLWALFVFARGAQRHMAVVVRSMLTTNVLLTVVLVVGIGPLGAAIATVVASGLLDLVLTPLVLTRRLRVVRLVRSVTSGLLSSAGGLALGAGACAICMVLALSGWAALVVAAVTAAAAAITVVVGLARFRPGLVPGAQPVGV